MIKLRPYQAEAARAIMRSVTHGQGLTLTVEMARQAGKNELSAWIETALLTRAMAKGGTGIKAAPTFKPQVMISIERLRRRLADAGFARSVRFLQGNQVWLGRASWRFFSAAPEANIVGATADILLEVDEAQDVDPDKYNKDLRPMASSTNATTVLYGTAWSDLTLLETTRQANRELTKKDGIPRNFEYPWPVVALHNRAYGRYVEAERQRLGPTHPLFTTQYDLTIIPGRGRLLTPAQLAQLLGPPPPTAPVAGATYVAGLDVAGEDPEGERVRSRDYTVLTIAEVIPAESGPPITQVAAIYASQGVPHDDLYAQIVDLCGRVWRVANVAVDATGMGEGLAILLSRALGRQRVTAYRLTEQSKSHLGYQLQAAAIAGRLRIPPANAGADYSAAWDQLRLCRATYKPNRTMAWSVEPAEGHDDILSSIALAVEAAEHAPQGVAKGRIRR